MQELFSHTNIYRIFPLPQSIGQMNPKLAVMAEGALENMKHWAKLGAISKKENGTLLNKQ